MIPQRPENRDHGRLEQTLIAPLLYRGSETGPTCGIERGTAEACFQFANDQRAIAEHVGADLQDGNAPIPTGKRDKIGLRHNHWLIDGRPGQPLDAEANAHLLRKGRGRIVMVNDAGHRTQAALVAVAGLYLLASVVNSAQPSEPR